MVKSTVIRFFSNFCGFYNLQIVILATFAFVGFDKKSLIFVTFLPPF